MKKILPWFSIILCPLLVHAGGETISPNMSLPIPGVGVTTGPQWATDINSSLSLIDTHDHSPGKGVPISPDGMNINADLSLQGNNLTLARSLRFDPQASSLMGASDIGALFELVDDLYYIDGSGNTVRLTQNGAIVGTPGSISGLVSPASASYVPGTSTFVWQSDVNTSANMDAACLLQRNVTASSNAITLCAPSALASNYSLTWPASLPASQKFMTMDSSGNMAAPWAVDNSTIEVNSNTVQVKNQGITQAKLAPRPTGTTVGAGGVAISASTDVVVLSPTDYVALATVTITTLGRPVAVFLISDGRESDSGALDSAGVFGNVDFGSRMDLTIFRGASVVGSYGFQASNSNIANSTYILTPVGAVNFIDPVAAGTYTYTFSARTANGRSMVRYAKLVAYEL